MSNDTAEKEAQQQQADFERLQTAYQSKGQTLALSLRDQLRNFAKGQGRFDILRAMTSTSSELNAMATILRNEAIETLNAGLYELLADCSGRSELPTASEQRTIAQTVDLLVKLFELAGNRQHFTIGNPLVLVVDDEASARMTMKHSLRRSGFHPLVVDTPSVALRLLKENKFDLLLFDIMMPDIDGYELGQRARENEAHQNTPLVFVTAAADFVNRVKSHSAGAQDFIAKPFHHLELAVKAKTLVLQSRIKSKG